MGVNKFRWEFGALTTPVFGKPVLPDISTNGNIRSANPFRVSAANCRGTTRLVRDNYLPISLIICDNCARSLLTPIGSPH